MNDPYSMNTGALAFVGDAVYELHVREYVIGKGMIHGDVLHKKAVRYVNARAQAAVIKEIIDSLNEKEQGLVRRARNRKISTKPKNIDPISYKWATAFEALLGYYYLSGQVEKLDAIVKKSIQYIEG